MTDTERLDWMADERFFDGLGDVDIDEETLAVFSVDANGKWKTADCSEEEWKVEWRNQMRLAIDKAAAAVGNA